MSTTVMGQSELLDRYPYGDDPDWPILLADLKLHAQVDHSAEDTLLQLEKGGWLASATEEVESRGQVSLMNQKRRILLDCMPSEETIFLPRGKASEITIVKYLDADDAEQTLSSTLYRGIFKGRGNGIYFKDTSTIEVADGAGVVWVDYVAGYGTDPQDVPAQWRSIIAALATHMYERREMVAGGGIDEAFEKVIDRKIVVAGASRRYV